jgi:hypothetical protein
MAFRLAPEGGGFQAGASMRSAADGVWIGAGNWHT